MTNKRLRTMDPINISDLPEPIVHHIMSFLTTTDVTRLSILSKKFFSLWGSYPVIEFDQKRFARTYHGTLASMTKDFIQHVLNSIRQREINAVLSEFRVNANFELISVDSRFDTAILMVLKNGVTCMELNLGFADYVLPNMFASNTLHVLRLKGLHLDLCGLIKVCPSLTTVLLKSCVILKDAEFSSKTLREIELHSCDVKCIKIDGPNLRSFFFSSDKRDPKPCDIDVLKCRNIKYLSLNNVVNGGYWIEEHVYTLSELKTFILNRCQDIGHIRICNDKLVRVEFRHCHALTSIEVRATSLESFAYEGIESAHGGMPCNITFLASKCIKDLSLKGAALVTDQWLETQLAIMTRLERLKLKACNTLRRIKVIHEKLLILELCSCLSLVEAEIHTPQLISFTYQYGNANNMERDKMVTDQWLESQLAKMTRLERLRLKRCNSLKKIKVWHEKLQILELCSCNGLEEADIDTPQLISFMYHGNVIEFGKMVTRGSCIATLSMIQWTTYDNASFCKWRNMLSFFGHCKALRLICNYPKEMMMPELHRERLLSPLFGLQHLEVQIKFLDKIDGDLVDGLLWLSPLPNTLHVSSSRSRLQIKFVYNHYIEGEEDGNPCCATRPIKCWKHHLKRLEIQSSDVFLKNGSNELQKYFLTNANIADLIVSV
ncbi:putative F-box domain, leucine-rich repeat domain superfamily, F-box-like domain superfamily [Helianthus debilis subsp. tardiflorus]